MESAATSNTSSSLAAAATPRLALQMQGAGMVQPSVDNRIFGWGVVVLFTGVFLYLFRRWRGTTTSTRNGPSSSSFTAAAAAATTTTTTTGGGSRNNNNNSNSSSSSNARLEEGNAHPLTSSPLRRKRHDSNVDDMQGVEMIRMPSLRGIDDTEPCMLQRRQISHLCTLLPTTMQLSDWVLLYTSARDGYSLETFYQRCEQQGPTLVIVSDTSGALFGAFHSTSWRRPTGGDEYYGTGECFVFRQSDTNGGGAGISDGDNSVWQKYAWTGVTDEFVMSGHDVIAFGGGGKFALTLDSNFRQGSSETSPTFGNPSLASSTMFTVASVEVWAFQASW
jgi:hypothetical protein